MHPNMAESEAKLKKYRGLAKYWHRCDEGILKPLFIRNHEKESLRKQKEFFEIFMAQGQELEREFGRAERKAKVNLFKEATLGMVHIDGHSNTDGGSMAQAQQAQEKGNKKKRVRIEIEEADADDTDNVSHDARVSQISRNMSKRKKALRKQPSHQPGRGPEHQGEESKSAIKSELDEETGTRAGNNS